MKTKIEIYKGFEIINWTEGFERYFLDKNQGGSIDKFEFGLWSKFLIRKDGLVSKFAFAIAGLDMIAEPKNQKFEANNLMTKAMDTIKIFIDSGKLINDKEYTFEFHSQGFFEVNNPIWT